MQCVVCIMFILSSSTMIKSQIRNATFRKIVSSPSENVKTLKEYSLKHARTPASMTCSARCLETRTCSTFSVCYHEQDLRCRLYDDPGAPNNITEVSSTREHYLMVRALCFILLKPVIHVRSNTVCKIFYIYEITVQRLCNYIECIPSISTSHVRKPRDKLLNSRGPRVFSSYHVILFVDP